MATGPGFPLPEVGVSALQQLACERWRVGLSELAPCLLHVSGPGLSSPPHLIAQMKHPVALNHHVRAGQQVLCLDLAEVALA